MKDAQSILRKFLEENPELLADFGDFESSKDIPKERLDQIYDQAIKHFNEGKFEQAKMLFLKLNVVNFDEFRYMYWIASCFFGQKDYENAETFYLASSALDPRNPEPHYYLALCYRYLGKKFHELVGLRTCVSLTYKHPLYESLYNRAEGELKALQYELEQFVKSELVQSEKDRKLRETLENQNRKKIE